MKACTIVAWNYLAYARVLAESFRSHHPGGRFSVLLLDDPESEFSAEGEPFQLVRPQEIMEASEFRRLSLLYEVTELATAVKPWLLRHLLKDSEVVFFDPDIRIFSPLDEVAELAREHSIVLTPHDVQPMPRDLSNPTEIQVLQSGAYNLGFIALGRDTESFLDWWADRLMRHCVSAPEQGMFVDQRWIDLVPGYFRHFIWKDPGCNVAYWNLSNRKLTRNGSRYLVNGVPLRFFHFSGFDPDKPHLLSRHSLPSPRVLLSENEALIDLCRAYANELRERGHGSVARRPYGLGTLKNGIPIDRRMRRIYREALLRFERGGGEEPPSACDPDSLVRWLNEDVVQGRAEISRYLHSLYCERLDLRLAFPDLAGMDGERYLTWARETGVEEARIPAPFLPPCEPAPAPRVEARTNGVPRPGVNVVGYFRAELGVGEAARQVILALEQADVPYATVTLDETESRQEHPFLERRRDAPYDVNILCVNADMLPGCARKLGPEFFQGRYTIGLWHWELSTFPTEWHGSFAHVDEIWMASEYSARSLASISPKPVRVIPPPVIPPLSSGATRAELGLPEEYLFLFVYDFLSVMERKNPLAVIEAFGRAFAPGEGPVLVLKSINGPRRIDAFEQVKVAAANRPGVTVRDGYVSREALIRTIASCDCYVSLHRAEGFGLTMAEAMVLGKPVIATGVSGNLTFMTEENAYLVRHRAARIPEGCDPYPAGAEWAEPDIDHAAECMRRVYEHPEEALEKGGRARRDILERHAPSVRAAMIGQRLAEIRRERAAAAPVTLESPAAQATKPEPAAPVAAVSDRAAAASQPREGMEPVEAAPSGSSLHDRAYYRSMEFPGNPGEATIRFRPILPLARSFLYGLLRPYTVALRAFHAAILELASSLEDRIHALEREELPPLRGEVRELRDLHRALRNEIEERDRAALGAHRELQERMQALEKEIGEERTRSEERLLPMEKRIGLAEENMGRAFGRHGDIERHLARLVGNVSEFQDAAKAHLASLTTSLSVSEQTLDRLSRDLHALPYTSESLRVRDEEGRTCIGYDASGESRAPLDVYPSFEDTFRGSEPFIKERLRFYVDLVRGREPVVDIGCGRGEFLDLLAESGLRAEGVDGDPGMIARCRERGHPVTQADAVEYLSGVADGSLGCIFSAHVIEHLPFESLLSIFRLARRKLAPNGLFIAETVNPHSIAALKSFWIDLTHQKPIFPEVAVTLCRLHGFPSARILFPRGSGNLEEDLWQQGEYAVVARTSTFR